MTINAYSLASFYDDKGGGTKAEDHGTGGSRACQAEGAAGGGPSADGGDKSDEEFEETERKAYLLKDFNASE
jgi:hypothetical protein